MQVALIARVVAQQDGQIELERLVTPEMAERMRRDRADEDADRETSAGKAKPNSSAPSTGKIAG